MDFQLAAAILFIFFLTIFIIKKKNKIILQKIAFPFLYFCMYKTKFGIKAMDKLAKKFPKTLRYVSLIGIITGFLGMAIMSILIIRSFLDLFLSPASAPGVALVLPIKVKGSFYVPFFYWIVSIFILAISHEFAHGVMARVNKVKIKSSGFAFLGIILPLIPAAFVEPDEKALKKKSSMAQFSVFAAGPFANIAMSILIIFLFGFSLPGLISHDITSKTSLVDMESLSLELYELKHINLLEVEEDSAAYDAGLRNGVNITHVQNVPLTDLNSIELVIANLSVGDNIVLSSDNQDYNITLGQKNENDSTPYLGILLDSSSFVKGPKDSAIQKYGELGVESLRVIITLLYWLMVLNLGIGLFNLLPAGPLDGGRMLLVVLQNKFGDKKGEYLWKKVGLFFLIIILISIIYPFFM